MEHLVWNNYRKSLRFVEDILPLTMVPFTLQEYLAGVVTWNAHLVFEDAVDPLVKRCFQEAFPDQNYEQEKKKWQEEDKKCADDGENLRLQVLAATSGSDKRAANLASKARCKLGLEAYGHELAQSICQVSDLLIDKPKAKGVETKVDLFSKEHKIHPKEVHYSNQSCVDSMSAFVHISPTVCI